MRIKQRVIFGIAIILILIVILGGVSIDSIGKIKNKAIEHYTLYEPVKDATVHIVIDLERIKRAVEEYDAGWITYEECTEEINERERHLNEHFERLFAVSSAVPLTFEEARAMRVSINELYDLIAKLLLLHDKTREERAPVMEKFDEKGNEINRELDTMVEKVNTASEVSAASIKDITAYHKMVILAALGIIIIIAIGIIFLIVR